MPLGLQGWGTRGWGRNSVSAALGTETGDPVPITGEKQQCLPSLPAAKDRGPACGLSARIFSTSPRMLRHRQGIQDHHRSRGEALGGG